MTGHDALVNTSPGGYLGSGASIQPTQSNGVQFVTFASTAKNLFPGLADHRCCIDRDLTSGFVKDQLEVQRQDAKTIAGKKVRVFFYGDSVTYFWRSNPQIWDDTFSKFHPLNLGVGATPPAMSSIASNLAQSMAWIRKG